MKNLITELKKDYKAKMEITLKAFKKELKESDILTRIEKYTLNRKTPYKKNRVTQVENRINEIYNKRLASEIEKIEIIENASDVLPNDLVLIINFYKSSTWGYCPRGTDNYGHYTNSITGCGYCKESTATAQLLNQNEIILKKLYKAKNKKKNINKENRNALGYGSGYGIIPSFEGGVGVECHVRILESLGYKVSQSGNKSTTILTVSELK